MSCKSLIKDHMEYLPIKPTQYMLEDPTKTYKHDQSNSGKELNIGINSLLCEIKLLFSKI